MGEGHPRRHYFFIVLFGAALAALGVHIGFEGQALWAAPIVLALFFLAYGYDVRAGEYVDMLKAGIIDPAKVARIALESAASVAGLMLTTEVLVTDLKDEEKKIEHAVR